jgi:osmoprotectant transport system ATP-binding protein
MAAVALREVCKRFPNGAVALDRVTLEVPEGAVLVLLGTSGSGKTTALRTINAMTAPDQGSVRVLGRDVGEWDRVQLRRSVGYVIQEGGLLPHLSVAENVSLVPRLMGWSEARRRERTADLLDLVGLPSDRFAALRPSQLSGGQRQRVGIARALGAEPPLLLMDEPFGALDPLTRRRLQDDFQALQRRLRTTVILVTHDVPEALRLADRVAVMTGGRVAQEGTPVELRERPQEGFVRDFLAASLG